MPALVWLWFLLKEDSLNPEPKKYIIYTFIAGMVAVPLVVPAQMFVSDLFMIEVIVLISWAAIEEIFKLLAALFTGMKVDKKSEPIDPVIYMITVALGFSALENFLFITEPLSEGNYLLSIATGNMRFVGATLLHVVSSATIGVFMSLSFYKSRVAKFFYLILGLIVAVILHSVFNFIIIGDNGNRVFAVFYGVWLAIIGLLLVLEKIKTIKN